MAYDATKPTDDEYLSAFPAEMREQLRAIIQDAIVNALTVKGYSPGNLNGNIPVSNGNLNANLNADKLDGYDATYFSANGHVHAAATPSTNGFMSNTDKTKVDGIATGAEVNQNAFSNVAVGSTTIQADSKADTLTLAAGANIAITPDATNDKVTIAVTGTVPAAGTATTAQNLSGFVNGNLSSPVLADSVDSNCVAFTGYGSVNLFGQNNGALYGQAYGATWQHQIYGDYRSGQIAVRGKNDGNWQPWRTVIDSGNITSQSVAHAGTADNATHAGTATTAQNLSGFVNTNSNSSVIPDSIDSNCIAYAALGSIKLFDQSDGALHGQVHSATWQHQIYGDYRSGQIAVRGKNDGAWQPWRTVVDSGNIASQSVAHAGTADQLNGYTAAQLLATSSKVVAVQQAITWNGSLNDSGVVVGTWNPPTGYTREQCVAIASPASAVAQVNTVCASAETDGRVILRSGNAWTITYEVRVLVVAIK